MELIPAKCPECGADIKIPNDKDTVTCEYCGASIIVKNILGSGNSVNNFMELAKTALNGGSYKEAHDYYDKVLEKDSTNADAWFGKAICAGRLTGFNDIRLNEMLILFDNAIKYTTVEKQDEIKKNAATEINKAVMGLVNNLKGGPEFFLNPREGGGFSVSIGNIAEHAKELADESVQALERAHELFPENEEIKNNLDKVSYQANKLINQIGKPNLDSPNLINKRKSSSFFVKLVLLIIILIAAYGGLKKYFIKDLNLKNVNTQNVDTTKYRPLFYVANSAVQNKTNCLAIFTTADTDTDLVRLNNNLLNLYRNDGNNKFYINYFSNKSSSLKNGGLQFKHDKDWIISHSSELGLTATSEYEIDTKTTKFYRYLKGKIEDIKQP